MHVEADLHLLTYRLAVRLGLGDGPAYRSWRLEHLAGVGQSPPYELPSLSDGPPATLDQLPRRATAVVGIAHDAVAHEAAEQLVHRDAKAFALDVPERHVDGR